MQRDSLYWAGYYIKRARNEGHINPMHLKRMLLTSVCYLLGTMQERR